MIQLQFLNYLLDTKDKSLITLNSLDDRFFSEYKNEFNFIKEHISKYNNVPDKASFLSNFNKFELIEVHETPKYLIDELFRDYNTRVLSDSFNEIRKSLMNDNVEKAMTEYAAIQEKLLKGNSFQCIDLVNDTTRLTAYQERTRNFEKYYITTGFKELDNVIGGWDREDELATIVARTNYGKSWVLLKSAVAAAEQGLTVGLYSGEMSENKVGYRFDTLVSHISNGALVHGNESVLVDYEKFISELNKIIKGKLLVLTPKMVSGAVTVNTLRAFVEKENLDILFVDQLSLLEDQRNAKNPIDKMANISKDLKNLQVLIRRPIISVCQQNRTKAEDGLNTTQIAQSDRIGQDSTTIIFIDREDDIMKLILVKARDTSTGNVLSYLADFNTGTFRYIPSEDDANQGQTEINYEDRYKDTGGESVY